MTPKKRPIKAHKGTIVYNEDAQSAPALPVPKGNLIDTGIQPPANPSQSWAPVAPAVPPDEIYQNPDPIPKNIDGSWNGPGIIGLGGGQLQPNTEPPQDLSRWAQMQEQLELLQNKNPNQYSEGYGYVQPYKGFNNQAAKVQQFNNSLANNMFGQQQAMLAGSFNKGGYAMEQQMELFDEGGMKDDGMDIDPVSGNEVPPGSLAKEVRDDIPAQLSDGEYVVPADVVQYFGVKFFEDLRMEAKAGLRQMEETGRIGGEPVSATIIALGEAEKKKAQGGPIYADKGVLAQNKIIEGADDYNYSDWSTLGFTKGSPVQNTKPKVDATQQVPEYKTYYNSETGEVKTVTFVNKIVTPATDIVFTQPPWSMNKPTQTQKDAGKSKPERDDSKDNTTPGWGADPNQYDFTGWDQKRWDQEVTNLLKPAGGNLGIIGGFFKTAGATNAKMAINLMEAAGFSTKGAQAQLEEVTSSFNTIQKGVYDFLTSDKVVGDYPSYIKKVNPTYSGSTSASAPPSNNNNNQGNDTVSSTSNITKDTSNYGTNIKELSDARKDRMEKDPSIKPKGVDADLVKKADATPTQVWKKEEDAFDRATPFASSKKNEFDDGAGGAMINKGGLLRKPKSNPKKPRGKGLGNKK